MTGLYRYCRHGLVDDAVCMGWLNLGPLPGNHGLYGSLVYWPGNGDGPWFDEVAR